MHRFWTTAQLLEAGRSEREVRRALERGAMRAVRKGLHATPGTGDALVRAARTGGVLTGPSAATELGLWVPPDPVPGTVVVEGDPPQDRLHVAAARHDARLRDPDRADTPLGHRADVVVHRMPADRLAPMRRAGIAPVEVVLQHCFASLPAASALAVVDSALQHRHLGVRDLPAVAALLPPRLHRVLAAADGRAESGLETIVRYRLRLAGLDVEIIVGIRGVGSVDLVVEGRLIIELDGRRYHSDPAAFARDRRRDTASAILRYRTLRFTWYQVLFQWEQVEAAVFAALATR